MYANQKLYPFVSFVIRTGCEFDELHKPTPADIKHYDHTN